VSAAFARAADLRQRVPAFACRQMAVPAPDRFRPAHPEVRSTSRAAAPSRERGDAACRDFVGLGVMPSLQVDRLLREHNFPVLACPPAAQAVGTLRKHGRPPRAHTLQARPVVGCRRGHAAKMEPGSRGGRRAASNTRAGVRRTARPTWSSPGGDSTASRVRRSAARWSQDGPRGRAAGQPSARGLTATPT